MVDGEHPNTIGDHRGRPARPIQGDRVLAVTANRTGAQWAAVDDGGDQPAVNCPPTNPIAPRQIPQAQAAVPVEVSELRGRRADTVAGSRGRRAMPRRWRRKYTRLGLQPSRSAISATA